MALDPRSEATGSRQQRFPGGKAKVRLVQLLQAKGKTRLAAPQQLAPLAQGGPQWRSLGPATVSNGQTSTSETRMNVSGRVACIAVDPGDPSHVLCGSANGGVWESHDRGASWVPRTDNVSNTSVGAIAFDPGNPSVVYCGTGEGNFWAITGIASFGILRSTDRGASWSLLCSAPFAGQGFYDLGVDPADSNRLIAATTEGLYVSTDGGVAWTNAHGARTWSISIAPSGAPAEILAAADDGLWSSSDHGDSWTPIALPGAPKDFGHSKWLGGRLAVSIAPSNPAVAYAWGTLTGESPFLWRRADGVWTRISSLYPEIRPADDGSYWETRQAWYDWYVASAPDSDTEVYCSAIHSYRGNFSGTDWVWTPFNIHTDHHAIAFEPGNPNTVYAGSDGGLFRSSDRGVTWQHCNNGLVISQFEYIAQDIRSAQFLIGGTQDNGVVRWTGAPAWEHVADGDGGYCCVNPDNPQIVLRTDHNWRVERSTNAGDFNSFAAIYPRQSLDEDVLFYPPMRFNEITGDTVAIGGGVVYVSRENGSNWIELAFPLTARRQAEDPKIAMASAVYLPNADSVYVGTTMGEIFAAAWNGSSWTPLSPLTPPPRPSATISDLLVDPNNLNRMWATYSDLNGGRVYRSDDGGTTWIDRSAGLPNFQIHAVEVDSQNPDRVWVCAQLGVYQSLDGGMNWVNFSAGLPNAYIGDLLFHPIARLLRAATSNRGVWEIAVDG